MKLIANRVDQQEILDSLAEGRPVYLVSVKSGKFKDKHLHPLPATFGYTPNFVLYPKGAKLVELKKTIPPMFPKNVERL